jgi:hypothetical protein
MDTTLTITDLVRFLRWIVGLDDARYRKAS